MFKYFLVFAYRVAGVDYSIIKDLTTSTKFRYLVISLSLVLTTSLAFVGGFDIAQNFKAGQLACCFVGSFWAFIVLSLDFIIINSGKASGFLKAMRIPAAVSNVLITTIFLFTLLNKSSIDNKINATKAGEIRSCDSAYLKEKEVRYAAVDTLKHNLNSYHQANCAVEAANIKPGKLYYEKHSYCMAQDSLISVQESKLDSNEVQYKGSYAFQREDLLKRGSDDPFYRADILFTLLLQSKSKAFLAFLFLVFLLVLELIPLYLKFNINPDTDEYQVAKKEHDRQWVAKMPERVKKLIEHKDKMIYQNAKREYDNAVKTWVNEMLNSTLSKAPLSYKLNEYKRIFREQGMPELADEISSIQDAVAGGADIDKLMNNLINKINQN